MFSSDYKHFEKEFRTKFKLFSFSLVDRGSVIRITEWRKTACFSINLDLGGAAWLRDAVKSVLRQNSGEEFKRFYRNHSYSLIIQSSRNSAGRFMKIWKILNGTLSHLFIPEEFNGQGWRNFSSCLDSFFVTKQGQRNDSFGHTVQKQFPAALVHVQERKSEEQPRRDWRNAIVAYRNSIYISWGVIRKRVEDRLRREVAVVSLAADRAIIWCQHEEEISLLLLNPLQFSNGKDHVKLERWNQFVHWDNIQIHVKQSWIGIEGLPINMWNIHVFKIIGKSLGGLLEVAPETTTFNFLRYAKIKVGGLERGFMDPILEILCNGLRVCIGIFPIQNPKEHREGGRTTGLVSRAVWAEIQADETETEAPAGVWKAFGTGAANLFQPKQPSFILGKTINDDVATVAEKAILDEVDKADLLSACSDKQDIGKETGLTVERSSPASEEEDGGCQKDQAKIDQPLVRDRSGFARFTSEKRIMRDSVYDKNWSQFPPLMGVGHYKRDPQIRRLWSPGQTELDEERNYGLMGSNQAQSSDLRFNKIWGLSKARLNFKKMPALTEPAWGTGSFSKGASIGPGPCKSTGSILKEASIGNGPRKITTNQNNTVVSAPLLVNPKTTSNRFLPLQASYDQEESSAEFYSHKNLGVEGSIKSKIEVRGSTPLVIHKERSMENNQEETRDWVERTFYKEPSKIGGLGGKIEVEKIGAKWRAVELLNRVERIKLKRKEASSGFHTAALTPPNIKDSLSCSGQQDLSLNLPQKRQVPFTKGIIQLGPSGNSKTRTKTRNPSLRKACDHQKSTINWMSETGKNMKTKSLWVQRFFRNPNRKPFPWRFNTCGEEEEEGRKEIREEGIHMGEEDIDRHHEWNSSDNEDTTASEDDFSVPESAEGECVPPEIEDILQDVSKLFKEDLESNIHHDKWSNAETQRMPREESNLIPFKMNTKKIPDPCLELTVFEEEDDWRKRADRCGKTVKEMTHEEWKIINKVVEGVEIQEVPKLKYKGTNRGKTKKGMRELKGLQSSFNYEGTNRKTRELKLVR